MIKVSDFIAHYLAEHQQTAKTIFLVSGGGNMHIIDSIGKEKRLNYICNHHEQACAIAAEGYARISNNIGIAIVTTGPGGTNAITGVLGAWTDSIPICIISGQVKFITTIAAHPDIPLRQLGDQEINIVDIVKPITKYAQMVTDKNKIKYHLQKALYLAKSGRPGPVWLDIPLDIQGAYINPTDLDDFIPARPPDYDNQIPQVIKALNNAQRPVIIAGNGIRLADAVSLFNQIIPELNIPILTAISGVDLIESTHPLFFGRPGILGERAANFIVQNSDLVLILGTRLNLRIISFNWEYFARAAVKIMVDIDAHELNKNTFIPDIKINADVYGFLQALNTNKSHLQLNIKNWLNYCRRIKEAYPRFDIAKQQEKEYVSSYYFPIILSENLKQQAVIVTGNGIAYTSTYQVYPIKKQQRLFANVGCAAMGYDLPAAIGACIAHNKQDVICITGDGSIQMNLQELQTIIHNQLPIKIFMYNNQGYLSIRITQTSYFDSHFVGEGSASGVSIPDMKNLAKIYGFKVYCLHNNTEVKENMAAILNEEGAVFCEVMLNPIEKIEPKVASYKKPDGSMISKPLEDLFPFLPRDEFLQNMLIQPIEE